MNYTKKSLNIKSWAEEDRPREKMQLKGKAALSDAELLAILIASGNKDESAVELSKRILESVSNNLHSLGKLTIHDLKKFKGIGEAKAIALAAALELGRRRQKSEALILPVINSSTIAYQYVQAHLADLDHEEFFVVFLNKANKPIGHQTIGVGGVSATVAEIKLIVKFALEKTASGILVAHNHPSGNTKPSDADIRLTKKLKDACQLLEIVLIDHLIIGHGTFLSFADEGML